MGGILLLMRPINFVASIILARLLEPSDFGLIALALVLVQSSNLFTNLGMEQAIIHTNDDQKKVAFQSFIVVLSASILFCSAILIYSSPIAAWLGDPRILPPLRWLSGLVLIGGLSVVPMALLRKQMMFQQIALANLFSLLLYTASVIGLAYSGWGIWSLVYANLLSSTVGMMLLWLWCPGWDWLTPSRWDFMIMKRLFSYGMKVCGSGLLSYFHTHWDDWFVGRVLGAAALGFYSKAYDFSNKNVGQMIKSTIGSVFFSSYAKMQQDEERLSRAYLKAVLLVFIFVTPIALGVTIVAEPLVYVLLGTKWMPMVTVLQIFSLLILTRPISENSAPLFQAVGRPGNNIRAAFVLLAVMVPGVLYFTQWQLEGVAFAVAFSHLVGALYNIHQVNSILPGTAKKTFRIMVPILLNGIVMMLAMQLMKGWTVDLFGSLNTLGGLASLIGVGAIVYTILLFLTQRKIIYELWQILIDIMPRRLAIGKAV